MTQELVIAVLLTGFFGLAWVMRLASADSKQAGGQAHEPKSSGKSEESALKQQTVVA